MINCDTLWFPQLANYILQCQTNVIKLFESSKFNLQLKFIICGKQTFYASFVSLRSFASIVAELLYVCI